MNEWGTDVRDDSSFGGKFFADWSDVIRGKRLVAELARRS